MVVKPKHVNQWFYKTVNNVLEINTELLPKGPYYLNLTCKNGKDSRAFYKL